jgi:pilus assembly protein Flp/PilA
MQDDAPVKSNSPQNQSEVQKPISSPSIVGLFASERNCTFCLPCSLGADQSGSAKDAVPRENPAFSSRKMFGKRRGSMRLLLNFLRDETGATAIEYGLIAAGISLAIISIINGIGTKLNTKFTAINSSLK